jgi:HSP20 family protein
MALMRWRSMRDLVTIQDEINRVFENLTGRPEGDESLMRLLPAADIAEDKDSFIVITELPGLKKEDLKVTVQNNILTISGEKKNEIDHKSKTFHRVERSYGSFYRTFELPISVDPSKVQADFKDGILRIELPKSEAAKPKEIAINIK